MLDTSSFSIYLLVYIFFIVATLTAYNLLKLKGAYLKISLIVISCIWPLLLLGTDSISFFQSFSWSRAEILLYSQYILLFAVFLILNFKNTLIKEVHFLGYQLSYILLFLLVGSSSIIFLSTLTITIFAITYLFSTGNRSDFFSFRTIISFLFLTFVILSTGDAGIIFDESNKAFFYGASFLSLIQLLTILLPNNPFSNKIDRKEITYYYFVTPVLLMKWIAFIQDLYLELPSHIINYGFKYYMVVIPVLALLLFLKGFKKINISGFYRLYIVYLIAYLNYIFNSSFSRTDSYELFTMMSIISFGFLLISNFKVDNLTKRVASISILVFVLISPIIIAISKKFNVWAPLIEISEFGFYIPVFISLLFTLFTIRMLKIDKSVPQLGSRISYNSICCIIITALYIGFVAY
ncbi:MAG: hypothetical protein GY909_11825 [Oligoflexia bacterium]|nr:hypothetical protein [Oligoflexia bacterium]